MGVWPGLATHAIRCLEDSPVGTVKSKKMIQPDMRFVFLSTGTHYRHISVMGDEGRLAYLYVSHDSLYC